jgi:hypothetical protein
MSFKLLGFMLLPVVAALGHDWYVASEYSSFDLAEGFHLGDLGWVWKAYHLDSHNWALENMDPDVWESVLVPILKTYTVAVAAAPFFITLIVIAIRRALGIGGDEDGGSSYSKGDKKGGKQPLYKKKKMEYKRK